MKAEEIKDLNIDELKKKEADLHQELFNLRFQFHTGHLENNSRIPRIKKDIARVKTVLREKLG
jgi:large subunit ribosomal protein L29